MLSSSFQPSPEYIERLKDLYRQQKWKDICESTRVISAIPKSTPSIILYYRALAHAKLCLWSDSKIIFDILVERLPEDPRVNYWLGHIYSKLKEHKKALRHFSIAYARISLKESYLVPAEYSQCLLKNGRADEAMRVITKSLTFHKNNGLLLQTKADIARASASRTFSDRLLIGVNFAIAVSPQLIIISGTAESSIAKDRIRVHSGSIEWKEVGHIEEKLNSSDSQHMFIAAFEQSACMSMPGILAITLMSQTVQTKLIFRAFELQWPASAEFILEHLPLGIIRKSNIYKLIDTILGPAFKALYQEYNENTNLSITAGYHAHYFNSALKIEPELKQPLVSLIIPFYKRWDFLRAHLFSFASDVDFLSGLVELIVISDDPSINEEMLEWCQSIGQIHGVSFTLILSEKNNGFAHAVNLGASRASAETICIMNSDIVPTQTGWLFELVKTLHSDPSYAIATALLLYPDGSVQHAGMKEFCNISLPQIKLNLHPGKGLPWSQGEECIEIDSCSGALMVINRSEFQDIGGLSNHFVRGDFEDSHLCKQLKRRGRRFILNPKVRMLHSERASMPGRTSDPQRVNEFRIYVNSWLSSRVSEI